MYFLFFRKKKQRWQQGIRINLSEQKCFIKVPRHKDDPGKGGYWKLKKEAEEDELILDEESESGDNQSFQKPLLSYSALIKMAIKQSPMKRLTSKGITNYIIKEFPYFRYVLILK